MIDQIRAYKEGVRCHIKGSQASLTSRVRDISCPRKRILRPNQGPSVNRGRRRRIDDSMSYQIRASGSPYPRLSKLNVGLRGSAEGKDSLALGFDEFR